MSTLEVVLIIVLVVALTAVAALGWPLLQRRRLRRRFGPEYDRTVAEQPNRREAERELLEREKRHSKLNIRPLSVESRQRYIQEWTTVQATFVDDPGTAVSQADALLTRLMGERGYPTEGFEQQLADLSVAHATVLDHYRTAHDVSVRHARGRAETEELRQAFVHYRTLFTDLLGEQNTDSGAQGVSSRPTGQAAGPAAQDGPAPPMPEQPTH